jgi:D-alanyl-lipoteichoic acid acyltransferase DltB (MBOAT superfamily)
VAIAVLAVFKYFNFFSQSAAELMHVLGLRADFPTSHLVLPLGISFITFQGMAYVIDVWRGEHPAEHDLVRFLAFKAFFPQLIAGPIERASNLLDQFARKRKIDPDQIARAVWLLIYGYTIKLVIADGLAPIVDATFVPNQPFGWSVVLGTLDFGLQIYTDFWGYSLIAKGLALMMGFDLIWNFRFPYWATSPSDFWQRWHISLSRWLRDYLYIPLGGNRGGRVRTVRNLYITMLLGGLWHGASWNFVGWGFLHGTALATARYLPAIPLHARIKSTLNWALTMGIVFSGWFLFRATSENLLLGMLSALHDFEWVPTHTAMLQSLVAAAVPLFAIEWIQQRTRNDFFLLSAPALVRYLVLSCLCFASILMLRQYQPTFIYFQF